jgi:enamine deaminase RidA (YjgF/YER057c/UK114 family)
VTITRIPGSVRTRSRAVANAGTVYLVATAPVKSASVEDQMLQSLALIDESLDLAGSDRTKVLMVTVYLADMSAKAEMNCAWESWVVPGHAPVRACIGAVLAEGDLVELVVTAAV